MKNTGSGFIAWLVKSAVAAVACLVLTGISASSAYAAPFPIADGGAAMSFSFDGTNYLVGIENPTTHAIGAQMISSAGAKVGGLIPTGRTGIATNVSFDGTNYLLIWEDDGLGTLDGNTGFKVYGQRISPAGAAVGLPFAISSAGIWFDGVNSMAFGGGKYLVTYTKLIDPAQGDAQNNRYIAGQLVNPDGTLEGSEFRISDGYGAASNVIFDGTKFFVIWREDNADQEIRGRFVSTAGVVDTEFSINASAYPSDNPISASFDGTNYMVVWNDQVDALGPQSWDVFGQLVSQSGALVGKPFTITNEVGPQMVTSVAFDGNNYLAVWMDMTNDANGNRVCDAGEGSCWDMYGRYISRGGSLVGSKIAINTDAGNQMGGGGFVNGKYLVLVNSGVVMGQGGLSAVDSANGLFITPPAAPNTQYNAGGTYTYNSGTGALEFIATSSNFLCSGPDFGLNTENVTISANEMFWSDGMVWARAGGTAGVITGTWSAVDPDSGNSYTLVFDANTWSLVGNVSSCNSNGPPTINSFAPSTGVAGSIITINGSNFSPIAAANTVTFNGVPAVVTDVRPGQIFAIVPAAATTGNIIVTNGGGTATSSLSFIVTAGTPSATLSWGSVQHWANPGAVQGDSIDAGISGYLTTLAGMNLTVTGPAEFGSYTFSDADLARYVGGQSYVYKMYPTMPLPAGVYTFTLNDGHGNISHRVDTHVTVANPLPLVNSDTIQLQRKADGSYRFSWAPVNDTKTYYYRLRIARNDAAETSVYDSSRAMTSSADLPAGILFDYSMYKARVEAFDAPNGDLATNRSNSAWKLFSPRSTDYNSGRLLVNFATINNRFEPSQSTEVILNVNDTAALTAAITSIQLLASNDTVVYTFSADDKSGQDFWKNFDSTTTPPTLAPGAYKIRFVVNGITHYAYANLTTPVAYPIPDTTKMQAEYLGNGSIRFSWPAVEHTGALYYRISVKDTSTGNTINSPRLNQTFADMPVASLGTLATTQWRVEVYDSDNVQTQRNRVNSEYIALSLAAYDATKPVMNGYKVRNMNYPAGSPETQLFIAAYDSDGTITERRVDGPAQYTRNLTTPDQYSLSIYGFSESGSPAAGLYTFTATDNSSKTAVRYKYQPTPTAIPAVDYHTFKVDLEPNGNPRISWAPVVSDIPLWYYIEAYNASTLVPITIPSNYTAGTMMQQSSVTIPAAYIPGPEVMFRIVTFDGNNYTTQNNASRSVMVKAQPGLDYAGLTDANNDGYASNLNSDIDPFHPTAGGTYTYNSGNGALVLNWTISNFVCDGPPVGISNQTVTLADSTMTWDDGGGTMVWTRSSGTPGSIVGIWTATDATTGNLFTITINSNNTISVSGVILRCSNAAPMISNFMPASGTAGTWVTINGANFDLIPANNVVRFNGVAAQVIRMIPAAGNEPQQLIVAAPAGGSTGPISVTTAGVTATGGDFTYGVASPSFSLENLNPMLTVVKGERAEFILKAVFAEGFAPANGIMFTLTGNNALEGVSGFTPVPLKGSGGVAFKVDTTNLAAGSYQGTITARDYLDSNLQIRSVPVTLIVVTVGDIKFYNFVNSQQTQISSLNVTTQGNMEQIVTQAYDSNGNMLGTAPITVTSGNPSLLGVYGIYSLGNSLYALDNGNVNLVATTPDGFRKELPVSINVPNSPKVTVFSVTPATVSNKYTGSGNLITLSGTVVRPEGSSGVTWGSEGDMTGFASDQQANWWDSNYLNYNNTMYLDPTKLQEPRTVGLYLGTTTAFAQNASITSKREVPLTVFNDPTFSAGRFYIKSLEAPQMGPQMGGGTLDFCDTNGNIIFSRTFFEQGMNGWFEKGAIGPGSYKIRYTPGMGPGGGASQWYPNAYSPSAALPVNFSAGATAEDIYFFTIAPPVIGSFTITPVPNTLSVDVVLTATSSSGRVTDWCLTEAAVSTNCTWVQSVPVSHTFASPGDKTLNAFVRDNVGNITTASATATITAPALTVTFAGTGSGNVNSTPAGIACTSGNSCPPASYNPGTVVTLTASPSVGSLFAGWPTPLCTINQQGNCEVTMSEPRSITATFNVMPNTRIAGASPTYFGLLADAYAAAANTDTVQARDVTFIENLLLNRAVAVFFKGGYNTGFASNSGGFTFLDGKLTIKAGRLTVQGLKIK